MSDAICCFCGSYMTAPGLVGSTKCPKCCAAFEYDEGAIPTAETFEELRNRIDSALSILDDINDALARADGVAKRLVGHIPEHERNDLDAANLSRWIATAAAHASRGVRVLEAYRQRPLNNSKGTTTNES